MKNNLLKGKTNDFIEEKLAWNKDNFKDKKELITDEVSAWIWQTLTYQEEIEKEFLYLKLKQKLSKRFQKLDLSEPFILNKYLEFQTFVSNWLNERRILAQKLTKLTNDLDEYLNLSENINIYSIKLAELKDLFENNEKSKSDLKLKNLKFKLSVENNYINKEFDLLNQTLTHQLQNILSSYESYIDWKLEWFSIDFVNKFKNELKISTQNFLLITSNFANWNLEVASEEFFDNTIFKIIVWNLKLDLDFKWDFFIKNIFQMMCLFSEISQNYKKYWENWELKIETSQSWINIFMENDVKNIKLNPYSSWKWTNIIQELVSTLWWKIIKNELNKKTNKYVLNIIF